jgi:transglutaminase-like putative cysteine protease
VSAPEGTRKRLLVLAEASLAAISVAAVLGLGRLFADGSFFPQVAFAALTAHATAVVCRRRRLSAVPSALIAIVVAGLLITWFQLPETTTLGIPSFETLRQARLELDEAWRTFGNVVAPAPVLPGFVLAASVGAWVIAFAADTAAFRARAMVEAVVPAGTLFVFGGALGTGGHRLLVSAVFFAAVLVHWLAQRSLAAAGAPTWLSSEKGGGARSVLRAGVAISLFGILASVSIGPNLPGADARAVIPWRASDRDHPDARVTISPLVDIRSRLVDQADIEVFRVKSTERSYWRLTSLEKFDGTIWSSDREYRPARGQLGTDVDTSGAGGKRSTQTFTIEALSSIWLPAAFRPVHVDGADARYDTDSNSLLAEEDSPAGLTYTVESVLPVLTTAQLEEVPGIAPPQIASEYTYLPPNFSTRVQQEAGLVTRGATTQYEKAKALQDYFRSGEFTYDLNVPKGHSGDALEHFLFDTKRGYCEQFSGAYAAMARAVGLPARVAVGFTPGELDPGTTDEYVVKGFNGHAWPEVYLQGYGWVPFEPTPGRGMPNAEAWTGVPEAQADANQPGSATTVANNTTTTVPSGTATTAPQRPLQEDPAAATGSTSDPWTARFLVALAIVVLVPLLWAAALAVARLLQRRRHRARAATVGDRVTVAWDEVVAALGRAGAPLEPWETPNEYAVRATAATEVDGRRLAGLAGLVTTATYGSAEIAEDVGEQAVQVAAELEHAADRMAGRRARLVHLVDPRDVLPERAERVDVRGWSGATARRA